MHTYVRCPVLAVLCTVWWISHRCYHHQQMSAHVWVFTASYFYSALQCERNARIASTVLATAIPSVCLSVRHTPVLWILWNCCSRILIRCCSIWLVEQKPGMIVAVVAVVMVLVFIVVLALLLSVCRACIVSHLQAHCACPLCNLILNDFQPHLHLRYCLQVVSEAVSSDLLFARSDEK